MQNGYCDSADVARTDADAYLLVRVWCAWGKEPWNSGLFSSSSSMGSLLCCHYMSCS